MSSPEKKFDLDYLHVKLSAVYEKSPRLDMDSYINAYTEFNKFFGLMGTVFGFVSSDVTSKLEILQAFRQGPNGQHFETIEDMIIYEENDNKFSDSKYISGSRTLLRLHRALLFIALFLEELFKLKSDDKLSGACQKTYSATLGQYHPWIIQKAALMAMYALPTKLGLLQRIKGPNETEEHYAELLPKAVDAMKKVYDKTQKLYQDHNILELP
ncbi:ceramide-1-phosphate transfer protein-like [Daphnia carinata]|uniref:ceramide-1-phosphate transfer protein-like n=1 Tax=Daphnia carinata TaxID=120202 RepID=UPI00257AA5ED|nr:ceramide-1-phosphate transfer protein-like [Daphnia carinata]